VRRISSIRVVFVKYKKCRYDKAEKESFAEKNRVKIGKNKSAKSSDPANSQVY